MATCKKCNSEFIVPKNAIDPAYAIYCMPCLKKMLKKLAKMSTKEYMKLTAKSIGL